MRDVDPFEAGVLDKLPHSLDEVFHEVDRGNVDWRKIGIAVGHEEGVDLVLALELGRKFFGCDLVLGVLPDLIVLGLHL